MPIEILGNEIQIIQAKNIQNINGLIESDTNNLSINANTVDNTSGKIKSQSRGNFFANRRHW